jgi:hypothetical protein
LSPYLKSDLTRKRAHCPLVHELDGGTRRVLKLFSFKTKIEKNNLRVFMCRVKPEAEDIIEITAYMTWSLARSPLFW